MDLKNEQGDTSTYIEDYPQFKYVCDITKAAAWAWVKEMVPNVSMGCNIKACQMENSEDWLNKLFVVVTIANGKAVAITNWDDIYKIYMEH